MMLVSSSPVNFLFLGVLVLPGLSSAVLEFSSEACGGRQVEARVGVLQGVRAGPGVDEGSSC